MFPKLLLILTIALVLLAPLNTANAQLDQRCWIKQACVDQRKTQDVIGNQTQAEIEAGFYQGSDSAKVCGGDKDASGNLLGFCLPAGQTTTKITFGGQTKFNNIGEFITLMYRYGIAAAAIAAVVVIMHSGLRWVTSGGNSEQISASKKKIGGAMMGLFLAILSFSILNILNPAFVNLRLPQIWMVNTQGLVPPMCDAVQGKKLAPKSAGSPTFFPFTPEQATCGGEYYVEGGGTQTCAGTACPKENQLCFKGISDLPKCQIGNIGGAIRNSGLVDGLVVQADSVWNSILADIVTDFWAWPWAGEVELYSVCNNGEPDTVIQSQGIKKDDAKHIQEYTIFFNEEMLDKAIASCNDDGGFKGFAIAPQMNVPNNSTYDEFHLIGKGSGFSGLTDFCDIPDNVVDIAPEGVCEKVFGKQGKAPTELLFTKEELLKGFVFDIDTTYISVIDNDTQERKTAYGKFGWE